MLLPSHAATISTNGIDSINHIVLKEKNTSYCQTKNTKIIVPIVNRAVFLYHWFSFQNTLFDPLSCGWSKKINSIIDVYGSTRLAGYEVHGSSAMATI